ncbi:histidine phosphatase family protein [Shewanella sp. SR44-3]|uniref:histidine phosphatase family protein n=1 Tax=unclassified Shewanella TaxID=196818 RepID=UPI0015F99370|nr:histidine phosphatase family protein [Shewanella sp. SR44-3]MBB1270375.1 histidine phosphatase family protein [Shewanella sp. SR44-3]
MAHSHSIPKGFILQIVLSMTALLISSLLIVASANSAPKIEAQVSEVAHTSELVIFIVRHGEKAKGDNPSLTQQGQQRAQLLATMLASNKLDGIYSTDYNRTQETAAPTALAQQQAVQSYDPSQLKQFSDSLKVKTGRFLVVGHSNTTTALVSLLGGEPQGDIDDSSEFNRLYILTITPAKNGAAVTSVLLKYGE